MKIPLNQIDPNPFRDFGIDPVETDTEAFANMKKSIDSLEFWGGIAVRRHGSRFQAAFGHHRLEALRSLIEGDPKVNGPRFEEIDIVVVNFDDAQMARALATENATQRGNEGAAANDAVQAAIRVIGKQLLTLSYDEYAETIGGVVENFPQPPVFKDLISFNRAKTEFLKGQGVGLRVLLKHFTTIDAEGREVHLLTEAPIKAALSTLKQSGWYAKILRKVEEEIDQEILEAELMAEPIKVAKLEETKDALEEAIETAENMKVCYDPVVDKIFNRDAHAAKFKELVTSGFGVGYIDVDKQADLARLIIKTNQEDDETKYLTASYVREMVYGVLLEKLSMDKKRQEEELKKNANERAEQSWAKIKTAMRSLKLNLENLNSAFDGGGFPDASDQDIKEEFTLFFPKILANLHETELRMRPDDTSLVSIQTKKGQLL